ncbi:hypothetical protein ACIBQX_19970 [Nonomuraea sp. NPDC049714]|uniref:hypothetical protein n=1 Tax=Nonomuraea sp. NPDC049714 TaxID=3364357 RepID=UPI003789D3ED
MTKAADRPTPTWRHRYGAVVALPSAKRLLAGSLIGHMPIGMVTLTLLLGIAHSSGSYSFAGVVVGLYVTASGLVAPLLGRRMDRHGIWPVLAGTGVAFAIAMMDDRRPQPSLRRQ